MFPGLAPLALAALLAGGAPPHAESAGSVVIVTRPMMLDAATARELCPDANARLRIRAEPSEGPRVEGTGRDAKGEGANDPGAKALGANVPDANVPDARAPDTKAPAAKGTGMQGTRAPADAVAVTPDIDPFASLGAPAPILRVDTSLRFAGDAGDLAARVAAARCIVLEGGTWVGWWSVLQPQHKLTRLGRALVDAHRAGATIVGVGPAGSYLCELGILAHANMNDPVRDPHDTRRDTVVAGLGLVHGACFDFATDGRTTPEGLLDALRSSDAREAVWLAGACAWIQGADGHTARVAGSDGAAFVFDLSPARRSRESILGGRLLRVGPGQRFDVRGQRASGGTTWAAASRDSSAVLVLDEMLWGYGSLTSRASQPGPDEVGAEKTRNSGQVVELRGKSSSLRLSSDPRGALADVSPSDPTASSSVSGSGWVAFDWIQPR